MNRIRKAYEIRFRALLDRLGVRRVELGSQRLLAKAKTQAKGGQVPMPRALTDVYTALRRQVGVFQRRRQAAPAPVGGRKAPASSSNTSKPGADFMFVCDAGLGGLARWLRAAGYEAAWNPDIGDAELLREAQHSGAMILTTDSLLLERRLLRDGVIPALWLPPILTVFEQLTLVFQELGLTAREPRCMSCGGELRRVEKESMRERIPPKTWRWVDEYFLCARCDKLFWYGTHWQRIQNRLRQLDAGPETV